MKPALVIIDIQNWFFRTKERKRGLQKLISKTNELIDFFHENELPIIHVLTVHKSDRSTWDIIMKKRNHAVLIEDTKQSEELSEIKKFKTDIIIKKTRHSSFIRSNFENILRENKIDTLILTGVFIHGCVALTAIEGYERDFNIIFSKDATFSHEKKKATDMLNLLKDEFDIVPISNSKIKELVKGYCIS